MVASLLLNLISHRVSVGQTERAEEDDRLELCYGKKMENYKKRRSFMRFLNFTNIGLLSLGILFIVLFTSINVLNKNKMENNKELKQIIVQIVHEELISEGKTPKAPTSPTPSEQTTKVKTDDKLKQNEKKTVI